MFAQRFFGGRYFAARYWPKVGLTPNFNPSWAQATRYLTGVYPDTMPK